MKELLHLQVDTRNHEDRILHRHGADDGVTDPVTRIMLACRRWPFRERTRDKCRL
jgi:hypothetical protein